MPDRAHARVNRDVIAGLLTRRFGLDDEAARTLAALSDGRVGRAYELAGSEEALSDRDEAISLLGLALNGKDVLRALEGLTRRRNDAIGVLWIWQDILRDAPGHERAAAVRSSMRTGALGLVGWPQISRRRNCSHAWRP
jgi:hypothetical protein